MVVTVAVTFWFIQDDVGVRVKAGLAELVMATVDDEVAWHPLSVTVSPTVLVPEVAQLIVYGPAPLPLTTVPPPKLQV